MNRYGSLRGSVGMLVLLMHHHGSAPPQFVSWLSNWTPDFAQQA